MIPPPYLDLFAVSFLLLFFELASIRWFGSTVVFLTFFTNIVLLATFLGMSVGSLSASGRRDWTGRVMPLLLAAAILACATLWGYDRFGRLMVDVGGQGSPQQVYFGTEYRARDPASFVVPIELLGASFFVLIALVFVGVGQAMGRAFAAAEDRLLAYISNLAGSLAGILAFALASFLRTPPVAWFGVIALAWMACLKRRTAAQIAAAVGTVLLMSLTSYNATSWRPFTSSGAYDLIVWSPYYKVTYTPATRAITTNNIAHQEMAAPGQAPSAYQLPYWLRRDAGGARFENVLVVGAGSGNDVAAALANGAGHVDAVEIDPAIYGIGRAEHPARPYDDRRVTVWIGDGRSFLRNTTRQYDLIVYALVDSLVLHSGYSSLRLESFLFTQEAFRDIAARLSPNGVFAAYNYFRQGWIVGRVVRMAETAFKTPPIVISLPSVDHIGPEDSQANRITVVLAGPEAGLTDVRRQFAAQSYWFTGGAPSDRFRTGFGPTPPPAVDSTPAEWNRLAPASVETTGIGPVPTDDWPFLYLRSAAIPAFNIRSLGVLAAVSVAILWLFAPEGARRPNWRMFFLGAGFMLIETKSVVHMALLFGSTWVVNSVVFFAILTMVLASNVFVWMAGPKRLIPYYAGLFLSLATGLLLPVQSFLSLPGTARFVSASVVTFMPIFFAGVVFSAAFRDSGNPGRDYAWNIAGAILGGLAESLSLAVGFNALAGVALMFYALAAVGGRRRAPVP